MVTNTAVQTKLEADVGFKSPNITVGQDGSIISVSVKAGDLLVSGHTIAAQGTNEDITLTPSGTGSVTVPRLKISSLVDNQILFGSSSSLSSTSSLLWASSTLTVAGTVNARSLASTDSLNELTLSSPTVVTISPALTVSGNASATNLSATTKISAPLIEATGTGNKIRFYFANLAAFPSATTWEGSFGYAADTKRIYLATSTGWVEVAQATTSPSYNNVTITGGSIDGTTIGASNPAAATFTSVNVTALPTATTQLTNKRYVDKQVYAAIAIAG